MRALNPLATTIVPIVLLLLFVVCFSSCDSGDSKHARYTDTASLVNYFESEERTGRITYFNYGGPRYFVKTIMQGVPQRIKWPVSIPAAKSYLDLTIGYQADENIKPQKLEVRIIAESGNESIELYHRTFITRDPDRLYEFYRDQVDLSGISGKSVTLRFITETSDPEAGSVRVAWGNPTVYSARIPKHPNIILICIDTLRVDYFDAYREEGQESLTPRMNQLAADGVVYEDVLAQAPWTLPSVASFLSGLYPSIHGAGKRVLIGTDMSKQEIDRLREERGFIYTYKNMVFGISNLDESVPIIPDLLGDEYTTFMVNSNGFLSERGGITTRFDAFEDHAYQGFYVTRFANNWLKDNNDKLFFLYLHYLDPHEWYLRYRERFGTNEQRTQEDRDRVVSLYTELTRLTDDYVGEVLDKLKELNLYNDSLIILCSDHGEHFWDDNSGELKGHGNSLENELLRTPLIVKFPGNEFAGTRVSENVLNIDIFATIMEAAGVTLDANYYRHGRSLRMPLQQPGVSKRESISEYMMYGTELQCLHTQNIKFIHDMFEDEYFIMRSETDENLGPADSLRDAYDIDRLTDYLKQYVRMAKEMGISPELMKLEKHMFQHFRNLGYIQ